jgi:NAD(P)-dependent dehydrogenase (short-subunit alcohol dehydrogenase family)
VKTSTLFDLSGSMAIVTGALSGGVLNEKPEDWDNVIETQLNTVFLLSKLAAKSMLSRKRGKIINIGSMYSFFGSGLIPSYSAAKGAIVQLTNSMAIELAPYNIQVNVIAPGWIETEMTAPVRTMPMKPMNDEISCADAGWPLGSTRRSCRDSRVSGFTGFGLRYGYHDSCRWRLCDPITS